MSERAQKLTCKVVYTEQPCVSICVRKPNLIKKRLTVPQKPLSTQLVIAITVLINSKDVRTQLAIATKKESQNKLICGSDKKANTQLAIAKEMNTQLAIAMRKYCVRERIKTSSLTSLKTFNSCNEQPPCVRTQLAINTNSFDACSEQPYVPTQLAFFFSGCPPTDGSMGG